ncbi:polysaccharide deacetylase family protein [Sediminivirga luteola]|uniref:NodB homology domain-containing protein n=1 Tax=Sediminivirga luteola TaxID=1774748 RepID=A0A8J2U0L5_9MICO|nr:polysaccharide deacetylase [Sediminivirga luteola]MCI2264506.1 polysaccharide deacetylase [Sediminivirga luteola]GGA25671.1 hypothetical protein GCM10011333_30800 [Sediminivirga luteola]
MTPRVAITLDFDAIALWMVRGMTSPGPVSRGEFGAYAIPRILGSLRSRDITATFFVPGHTVETYPEQCRMIRDAGHELALHGYVHELVSTLTEEGERETIERSVEAFDRVLGVQPVGLRTPSWDFTAHTVPLIEEAGLIYDSSLMGQDYEPYFVRKGDACPPDAPFVFGETTGIVEIPVAWSLDDYPQLEWLKSDAGVQPGPKTAKEMFEAYFDDFTYMTQIQPGGVSIATFHPQVLGRGQRMLHFNAYLDRLLEAGAGFVTCEQVARDFLAAGR